MFLQNENISKPQFMLQTMALSKIASAKKKHANKHIDK